jgi:hypothetical protein
MLLHHAISLCHMDAAAEALDATGNAPGAADV